MDQLTANLLDLLHELEGRNIPIMIGGGYGLFLKRQHLIETGAQMLLTNLPEPRATNDRDMFLRAEVLSDLDRTREVREAIVRLGYTPVEEAKFLQWKRQVVVAGVPQDIKIDVLNELQVTVETQLNRRSRRRGLGGSAVESGGGGGESRLR